MATSTTCLRASGLRTTDAQQLRSSQAMRAALATPLRVNRRQAKQAAQAILTAGSKVPSSARGDFDDAEIRYLTKRADDVTRHFASGMGIDDFMTRLEIALWQYGFQNDNSIAMVNLCRDEVTQTLKHKIDQVYGSSFTTHGLGGVLTCGMTGMGAGYSHSPVPETSGKERYVFFSFPHIAIDSQGVVGNISRPGRAATSCACGALIKSLGEIKRDGLTCSCKQPGVHDPEDIEYSILKQRLARRLEFEGLTDSDLEKVDLVALTQVAERTITSDLELLISKTVNREKADYAVVTGVQIHNWATEFDNSEPNLEFVAPTNVYVVVNGQKFNIDLTSFPGLTPRQIKLLAAAPDAHYPTGSNAADSVCNTSGSSTLCEIDPPYMYSSKQARLKQKERVAEFQTELKALTA